MNGCQVNIFASLLMCFIHVASNVSFSKISLRAWVLMSNISLHAWMHMYSNRKPWFPWGGHCNKLQRFWRSVGACPLRSALQLHFSWFDVGWENIPKGCVTLWLEKAGMGSSWPRIVARWAEEQSTRRVGIHEHILPSKFAINQFAYKTSRRHYLNYQPVLERSSIQKLVQTYRRMC